MRKANPLDAGAARLSASRDCADLEALMSFYQEGRSAGTFEDGIELALRRLLASPQFLVRAEKEPANLPAGQSLSHQRPGTGFPFVVLPVEQHSGRRTDQRGQPGKAQQPQGARATGAAHARRSSI